MAFRDQNAEKILFYAADLGHYIGDAHVPLHTTINYDGQLTGQKGLHSLWESLIPELELDRFDLSSRHKANYLSNPAEEIWETLRTSYSMKDEVLMKELEASKGFSDTTKFRLQMRRGREYKSYTPAFALAYSKALGNTVSRQLVKSADQLADFIYTSWIDAGRPNLPLGQLTRDMKKQLKKERKSFRKNHLIQDSLLLSRRSEQSVGE